MKVALQFYSVRNSLTADPEGTMRAIAGLGYRYWETCAFNRESEYNYGLDMPLDRAQALLKELNVQIIGCHLMDSDLVPEKRDALNAYLDYQQGVGCESPGLAMLFATDLDEVKRGCENMNAAGQLCKERGMRFHYHNHWNEFAIVAPDKYMLDVIMDYTDPDLVDLELDTFWATRGGMDPVEMMYRYRDRLTMLHQKDISADAKGRLDLFAGRDRTKMIGSLDEWFQAVEGTDGDYVEVGTGIMDLQKIIDAGNEIGVKYISLEQDHTTYPELESVAISMANFKKYRGLDWT